METQSIFSKLGMEEQFLTFFACLNVFLQNDSKLDPQEKIFLLNQARRMGLNWVDSGMLDALSQSRAKSLYQIRLLDLSQSEREHLLRALIACIHADGKQTAEEFQHLQELMSFMGLKKWDLPELGEKIRTIRIEDVDSADFAPTNQIIAFLSLWEFALADHKLVAQEKARIQQVFPQLNMLSYPVEQRKTGLAILLERILFGRGISRLPVADQNLLATQLSKGMSENEVLMLLVGLFNYHSLIVSDFEETLFDRMDALQEVLQLSEQSMNAVMDFFATSVVAKKDGSKVSPLISAMKICFSGPVTLKDRGDAWNFLDTRFGFSKLPRKVRDEAFCVVLSAVALDGVSRNGEEIVLDETIDLFGLEPESAHRMVQEFNQRNHVRIVLPEKYNMKEMRDEVRKNNVKFDEQERRRKIRQVAAEWEGTFKKSST